MNRGISYAEAQARIAERDWAEADRDWAQAWLAWCRYAVRHGVRCDVSIEALRDLPQIDVVREESWDS